MAAYVKFQRGSRAAYEALKNANQLDDNTLYFIYPEENHSVGELYLGTRIISGGDITIASASLDDLLDVVITTAQANDFLVYEDGKWVNKGIKAVAALIEANLGAVVANAQVFQGDATEDRTHLEVIADLTADSILAAGDIAIVKTLIANDKYQHTSYVYNGTNWIAMDGNYSADNVYFDDDFIFTEAIGTVVIPDSGNITVSAAGKNMKEFLTSLFASETEPEKVEPSVSLSVTNAGKSLEVGTVFTPTFTATFDDGSYTYGPEPTGAAVTTWEITDTNGNSSANASGSFADVEAVDGMKYSITAKATHSAGLIGKTNLGKDSSVQIAAGEKTKKSSDVTAYRSFFYGANADEVFELNSATIRSLTNGNAYSGKKVVTVKAADVTGAKRIIVAIPDASTRAGLTSVIITSSLNAPALDLYELQTETVEVKGVSETSSAVPYKVWVYQPANLGTNEIHEITLG